MGAFEAFYASPWQHPWLLWVAAVGAGAWAWQRSGLHPSVRSYCGALTLLSLVDAWLTSNHVYGIGVWTGSAASLVPLFFVLAGDFRYLVLLGVARADGRLVWSARSVLVGLAWTLIVPVLSQALLAIWPGGDPSSRVLFFVYEVAFFLLTLGILARHPAPRTVPWLVPVSRFVLLYYGLWAIADAILLSTGSDLGFALRVVPNVLYYGGMIAMIALAASRSQAADG